MPVAITMMLAGTASVAMGFVGYGAGVSGTRRIYADLTVVLLISSLIALVLDLRRPDRGSLDTPTQPLRGRLAAFPTAVP